MNQNKSILLIEDDRVDAMTVKRSLKELKVTNPLNHCMNGEEGIQWLEEHENDLPGIILLDLNMPKMNGIEFLTEIRKREKFKMLPVVVLTTSKEQQDMLDTFNLNVAGYMIKPVDYEQFLQVMKTISFYWSFSQLPY